MKQLTVQVNDSLAEWLDEMAKRQKRSVAFILRELIEEAREATRDA